MTHHGRIVWERDDCPCFGCISEKRGLVFWHTRPSGAGISRSRATEILRQYGYDRVAIEDEVMKRRTALPAKDV